MTAWYRVRVAAVCLALAGLLVPPASKSQSASECPQNLVVNGDFSADEGSLDGWTSNQNVTNFFWQPTTVGTTFYASNGCFGPTCITGTDAEQDFLYQTIPTEPGKFYTLTFSYDAGVGGVNELQVLFGSQTVEDLVNLAQGPNTYTVKLHATERGTVLNFIGRQDNGFSFLTAVSVTRI
jgi:hypothetical protein